MLSLIREAVEQRLNRRALVLAITLIAIISVSLFVTIKLVSDRQSPEFFVGVEFAYSYNNVTGLTGLVSDLKDLVNEVKNYTNLFVIGSLEISFNQTALNEACDYVADAGLHFIVLFTDSTKYSYRIFDWMEDAKQKYGDKFLGVYRYDEPGGTQLDQSSSRLVENATSYADAAANYVEGLGIIVEYYLNYTPRMFTADYGLYWFDYKAGYTAVFAEFGWNHRRQLHVALCRGAAKVQNRDWGVMITWEYDVEPYIESSAELYDDLVLAYNSGAKYVVVFNYPKIGRYGILTKEHFDALKKFWNYIHSSPHTHGVDEGKVAYVLPSDYGFGFRRASDTIWGLWEADELSGKIWNDVNKLLDQYGSRLDIVYSDPEFDNVLKRHYNKLIFSNEKIT